ncbi:MAG: DEAD/DEAH box helicase [Nocardioides sp.]|uniref:DEAD/DEAH box helicase n=1 Tax=Nocardioides sp. TaxID=35761 RepID=UPI0039E3A42C
MILDQLTDEVLRDAFDPLTLHRARGYAAEGRVSGMRITEMESSFLTASADVQGTRPAPYRVNLTFESDESGPWLVTTCSCPVHADCKHGAALALTLAAPREDPAASTDWEARLRALLDQLAQDLGPEDHLAPLAVEFEVESTRTGLGAHSAPGLRLRPLRLGHRGRWVKTGAEWSAIQRATPGHDFPRAQVAALKELARALPPYGYSVGAMAVPADEFGDHLVRLLSAAAEAEVTFLPGTGLREVRLAEEPLSWAGAASREDDGTVLRFGVRYDDQLLSGPPVLPIGRPAHSVALLRAGVLVVGRLAEPLPDHARRLVIDRDPLRVPLTDTDRLEPLLGPLARLVSIDSPDDSVPVPEPLPPMLRLRVTWRAASRAELHWEWAYGPRSYGLGSREDLGLVRDPDAERELRARIPDSLRHLLTVSTRAHGDALELAIHHLPALREVKDLEVVEVERPDFRESLEDPQISFEVSGDGPEHTDWLDLEVVVSVDGEQVPLPDVLAALTREEDFLLLPSGLYLSTDRPELARLREVVAAAAQLRERDGDRLSVGKHDLGVWAELAELGVVDAQAAAWVAKAQALRDLVEIPRPVPTGLAATLRSYQQDGFAWLSFLHDQGLGGILADDMGLGKTLQVLATIARAKAAGGTRPFLVVAPTSVVPAWRSEAARHTPGLRIGMVQRRVDDVAAIAARSDVVVTSYAMLRLEQDQFGGQEWAGLILDEAQQVKNHQSKAYAAVRRIEAPFRLAVTGTPFENRLMELWSLLSIVAPGLYPSAKTFRQQVVTPVEKQGDELALARFRTRIRPFLLRRTKELVAADLPPKQEQVLTVELSARHRRLYDAHLAKQRQRILRLLDDFDGNRVAILSAITRLRQLALDPALVDAEHDHVGSAKLDVLLDHLVELTAEGHRALVFSQFTTFLDRARRRLEEAGIELTYLDGATRDREGVVERFRTGAAQVFLISLKAGGVGLTLTEADYVFVLDPWWNPAAEAQAVDRAHRIGQTEKVMVYRLVSAETIEEKVMELQGRKAELFARVVDGEGLMSTAIDADDIRRLFDH